MTIEQQALDLVKENEALKAKLWSAQSILRNNLEWVRCGIGSNCSGYPKDHPDYLLQLNYLSSTPEQCLNSVKADAVTVFANRYCGDCTTEYQTKLNTDANEWVYSVTVSGEA